MYTPRNGDQYPNVNAFETILQCPDSEGSLSVRGVCVCVCVVQRLCIYRG